MDSNLVWLELASDDLARSGQFWADLFGWRVSESGPSLSATIGVIQDLGASIKENPGRGHVPSHWTPFIEVSDVRTATEKARGLGATVLYEVHNLADGGGAASTILDPTGAPLSLWQRATG